MIADSVNDTSPEAQAVLYALLRDAPAWRKLALMTDLNRVARQLALDNLRELHPTADDQLLGRLLADRILGEETALKVYGAIR